MDRKPGQDHKHVALSKAGDEDHSASCQQFLINPIRNLFLDELAITPDVEEVARKGLHLGRPENCQIKIEPYQDKDRSHTLSLAV